MKVIYAESCDCEDSLLAIKSFNPLYLTDERQAAYKHVESELHLQGGSGPRYFAYHVGGRHILMVYLDR